ncbi:MAG: pectinesterase family protein [Massilia sp.]
MLAVAGLLQACGGGGSGAADGGTTPGTPTTPTSPTVTNPVLLSQSTIVSGWAAQGEGTSGGAGAPASNTYVVSNRAELNAALDNVNSPTYATNPSAARLEPKIIYMTGSIYGNDVGNGKLADEAYYKTLSPAAANWDSKLYIQSADTAFMTDLNAKVAAGDAAAIATKARIAALSAARLTIRVLQKTQIQFIVPSNTTIMGVGTDAKLIDGYLSINAVKNVVIRNLELQAPIDLSANYDPGTGDWDASFDAITVVTGKQIWIDHCTLSDGAHIDNDDMVTVNGVTKHAQRHDGLIDIEDSSDFVTISYTIFKNHDKTNMVGGSGDQNGAKERAYNRLTFSNNIWENTVQRAPRARFGRIHVYNNYYKGATDAANYATSYYIGMGAESKILSESNAFELSGPNANASRIISNANGYQFHDVGSWINGVPSSAALEAAAKAGVDANYAKARAAADGTGSGAALNSLFTFDNYTPVLGWTPDYPYTAATSYEDVKAHNLAYAGAGKLAVGVAAASAKRPFLTDAQAATYTVAKALAGTDAWAPQTVNAGHIDTSAITPDYTVAKDGSGNYTTIQAALNAASNSSKARVYIKVKAGTYPELLVASSANSAVTLYSTESDASKVLITSGLYQDSTGAAYNALVNAATYTGNTDASALFALCTKKTTSIGKECSTAIRVRNNGFNAVNMTFQNTDSGNGQALAVMIDKADKVVFDKVRMIGKQDTLYLSNSGKRAFFVGGEIVGDVDFIFGPGTGVFSGATIRYYGVRKPAGGFMSAPSTLASQTYGFLFDGCVFLADAATTKDTVFLTRQWDDGPGSVGKMIVRNSVMGEHVAFTNGPWNATALSGAATTYKDSVSNEPYLAEYGNWQEKPYVPGSTAPTTPIVVPPTTPTGPTTPIVVTDVPIAGGAPFANFTQLGTVTAESAALYDSVSKSYSFSAVGVLPATNTTNDSLQYTYKAITGNFTMIARITSLEVPAGSNTGNVRAGLMLRNTLSPVSRYFGILVRGVPRVQWEQRLADSASASSSSLANVPLPSSAAPLWLRLKRTGQVIAVSYSTDGVNWLPSLGDKTQDFSTASGATALDSTVYIGIAAVSGTTTSATASSFDNVSITAN